MPEDKHLTCTRNTFDSATMIKAKIVEKALLQNLSYLSSFEIHVPAFSSAQLALTAASVVPLKKTKIEAV